MAVLLGTSDANNIKWGVYNFNKHQVQEGEAHKKQVTPDAN